MPVRITWTLFADHALAAAELDTLRAFVAVERDRPWQVGRFDLAIVSGAGSTGGFATGRTTMPSRLDHPDWTLLLATLSALHVLLPGVRLDPETQIGFVSWNAEAQYYQTVGYLRAIPPLPPAPAAPPDEAALRAAYADLIALPKASDVQGRALVAAHDRAAVARIGMELMPTVPRKPYGSSPAQDNVGAAIRFALADLADITALVPAIAALWQAGLDDALAMVIAAALVPVAGVPSVRELARATLLDPAASHARGRAACALLASAPDPSGTVVNWLIARIARDRTALDAPSPIGDVVLTALGSLEDPRACATILLEAERDPAAMLYAILAIGECDEARALPYLERWIGATGVETSVEVMVLRECSSAAAVPLLLRFVADPDPAIRASVSVALAERGHLDAAAAIWRTIDASGIERKYDRRDVLRAFGMLVDAAAAATAVIDWDALVRSRDLSPLPPLPPLGTPLDWLTAPSRELRRTGYRALQEAPDRRTCARSRWATSSRLRSASSRSTATARGRR